MRLLAIAVVAWLAAAVFTASASAVVYWEMPSAADLVGVAVTTFVASSVLVLACYLPGLWLLRRRFGGKLSPLQAATATGIGLNIPAFLVLAIMASRPDVFAAGEAAWFAIKFLLFGLFFGVGFARYCQQAA
jgi:hypothetical protein